MAGIATTVARGCEHHARRKGGTRSLYGGRPARRGEFLRQRGELILHPRNREIAGRASKLEAAGLRLRTRRFSRSRIASPSLVKNALITRLGELQERFSRLFILFGHGAISIIPLLFLGLGVFLSS